MRIQELNLLAYGKFTDHKLAFPTGKHDFHVIIGPNEAGKSTVRRAISELLFGMERQSPLGFKHPQSDLRISAVVESASGKLTFVRSKQQKSLRSMSDEPLPDSYLAPALGSLTQEAFEQLHCLDHERLVKGGQGIVDPGNSVSQILFQAASGLDTFTAVREALAARAGELFANRGRNNEYTKAADRYAAARKTLKEVQVRTREWVEARDEFKNVDEELDEERNTRGELQLQRSAWERARRLGPLVERLARLQLELEELGDTTVFPPSAKQTLDAGISDMNAAAGIVQTREDDVKARQQELDAIAVDERVLERGADIESLARLCGLYVNHPRDLLLRRNEVKQWLVDVLARSAAFGWGTTEEDVRKLVPQEKVLRVIDALLMESGALLEGERAANDAVEERQAEAHELQGRLDAIPDGSVDPQLSQALSEALPYKNTESRQKNLQAAVTTAEAALKRAMAALGRPQITEDSLRSMNLPSLERVATFRANRQETAQQAELARSLMEQNKETAANLELQVSQFERSHKVVTAGEVSGARRERDDKWGAIKSGTLALSDGAPQLDVALRLADELVDARTLSETDGVTLQGLRDQHESAKDAQQRHTKSLYDTEQELEEFDARWSDAASQMGLEGIELDDMPELLAKRDAVLVAAANYADKKQESEHERDSVNRARNDLAATMTGAGLTVNEATGLTVLCSLAEGHIKGVDRERVQRESLRQQLRDAESLLRLAQQTKKTKAATLRSWNTKWQETLQKAHLGGVGEDVAEAEAAVQTAGFIRQRLEKIDAHRVERIETMEADLEQLKTAALALAQSLIPELVENSHDEISRVLSSKLEHAKRQSHRKTQAQEFLDDAKRQLAEARSTLEQAKRSLEPLLKAARVEDPMLALPLVEKAQKKVELEASIVQTTNLLEEGSDGLTLEQVKAEVETHPAVEAPGRLTAIKDSLEDSDRKLTQLVQTQLAAKQKFDAIDGGDRGAVAEAQKQEALTDISEAGEEYLQLATASSLLKWAVDKYRDRKQGPLLLRAGAVFKELTRGSFEKLRIDYDQSSPALLAYRVSGQPVKVSGLSDGTRDQLFLALRVAALELQTEQSAPIPFVADDLFINFDDNRSQAGLQALYELSTKTQVLFLSHHEHLLPVLEKLFGGVNVIALEGEEMLA